jgi:nitroreductase
MNSRRRIMCMFDASAGMILDEIINARRTYRMFRPDVPPKVHISGIIQAGLAAPFAAAAVGGKGNEYFRKFFVFPRDSRGLTIAGGLLMQKVHMMAEDLENGIKHNPALQSKGEPFARRLEMIRKAGVVPGVETAPYYIVVAERKGFPPVEQQSLAHCLENMWLKATVLNLGFQLVSVTGQMGSDPEFCRLLGIPPDAFELNGCAVGYYLEQLPPSIRPPADLVTNWME